MKLYRTAAGTVLHCNGEFYPLADEWRALLRRDDIAVYLHEVTERTKPIAELPRRILAPLGREEVWAAGVTYFRSRTARMTESAAAGGGSFYDRVYDAERPELFFKSAAWRVCGPGDPVRIRGDAEWNVPEPELALCINAKGRIIGYTIGNDMSSRDIEGENPLYLPQAKVYDGSCALGPALLVATEPLLPTTAIEMVVSRGGHEVFRGGTSLSQLKREPQLLVDYLYRETSFPDGCILLTGTGVIPPDDFTLAHGDDISITIEGIGELQNTVS